mmetsp:Transcript_1737/g.6094  ORF Transcript_1737/g.6094 Transcript_1737/m.6094 type:complete len:206 (-) Transcript_1737:1929-2546(-)
MEESKIRIQPRLCAATIVTIGCLHNPSLSATQQLNTKIPFCLTESFTSDFIYSLSHHPPLPPPHPLATATPSCPLTPPLKVRLFSPPPPPPHSSGPCFAIIHHHHHYAFFLTVCPPKCSVAHRGLNSRNASKDHTHYHHHHHHHHHHHQTTSTTATAMTQRVPQHTLPSCNIASCPISSKYTPLSTMTPLKPPIMHPDESPWPMC